MKKPAEDFGSGIFFFLQAWLRIPFASNSNISRKCPLVRLKHERDLLFRRKRIFFKFKNTRVKLVAQISTDLVTGSSL
tara:strand:- start:787 stop:1020 length:234 start_codon:yes stop_codon:yes gene_type:complete